MVASSQRRLSVSHVLSAARHPRRDEATCREAQQRGRWGWRGGWQWDLQWGGGGGGRFGPVGMSSVMSAPSVASARERRRRPRRRGERSARGGEDGAARRRPQRVGVGGSGVCRRMQAYAGVCRRVGHVRLRVCAEVRLGGRRGAVGMARRGNGGGVRSWWCAWSVRWSGWRKKWPSAGGRVRVCERARRKRRPAYKT